jgi:hypothetical protein
VKISAFDFAGANGFNQNAWPKDQEFAVCEAGGAPGFFGRRLQQGTSAKP